MKKSKKTETIDKKRVCLDKDELLILEKLGNSSKVSHLESMLYEKLLEVLHRDELIIKLKIENAKKELENKKKILENDRKEHTLVIQNLIKKYNIEGSFKYDPTTGEIL